jgi:putative Holliday junction resolvase
MPGELRGVRILALDHGSRRIGVAWSDALLVAAHPGTVIHRTTREDDLRRLRELCDEREAALVVVGIPRNMDGSEGPQAREARAFLAWLEGELDVPVEPWDERLTSAGADQIMDERGLSRSSAAGRARRRAERDALAACLILGSYLEAHRAQLRHRLGLES